MTQKSSTDAAQTRDDWALNWVLIWAAENGHLGEVEALIKAGANVQARDDSALQQAACKGHLQVIEALIKAGADPDHPCLEEAAQEHAALRAWLEHRRLTQAQPEAQPNPARRGLSRANH